MVVFLFFSLQHIHIVYTNDIHGHLEKQEAVWIDKYFPPGVGNGYIAPYVINHFRKAAEEKDYIFLLLDAGDIFQGTPIGDFSDGRVVVDYFNYMGYDYIAIGNHDFDRGYWIIDTLRRRTDIPFLSANLYMKKKDSIIPFAIPYLIFEKKGIKIGIFSVITQYLTGQVPPKFLDSIIVEKEIPEVRKIVSRIRDSVDILIGLTHVGLRHDRRIADSVPGIDIIVGGHSHTGIREPEERGSWNTIIVQTYGHLTTVGFLDVVYDIDAKIITGYRGYLIDLLEEKYPSDTVMQNIINSYKEKVEKGFNEIIGKVENDLTRAGFAECTSGNLITDAMRKRFNADVGIHNSGGTRRNIKAGDVTYRDVYNMIPFENYCVIFKVKGEVLKEIFEVGVNGHHAIFQISGAKIVYDPNKQIGNRIVECYIGNKPLDSDSIYTIVTNSFLAGGGGEYSVFLKNIFREDVYYLLRDVVADYIRENSPVSINIENRIIKLKSN